MNTEATAEMTGNVELDMNLKKLNNYLNALAGHIDNEVTTVLQDHCYARAWNWKPESIYIRPMKKIFFANTNNGDNPKLEDELDVTTVPENLPLPPLFPHPPQIDDCQRLANFARSDFPDDWEDKIDRTFWSSVQTRLFTHVHRILTEEHLSRLVSTPANGSDVNSGNNLGQHPGPTSSPVVRRVSLDAASKRFRHVLASTGYDFRLMHWLHALLLEALPRDYLAIYLDILQTLRAKIPLLIDKILATQPTISTKTGTISWETLSSVLKRTWDPVSPGLNSTRPKKLPGNPILIITPSGISQQVSQRQQKWIVQLNSLATVVNVNPHFGLTSNKLPMTSCMDQLVQATRSKIQEIRADCPGRPLILVGFNTGAAFACQISQIEHVTAIVCLGFPFSTAEGRRCTPDDVLMDTRSPVMFVVGQNAATVRPDDIEEVRERMLVQTSLIVVGSADDHLRISSRRKREGITQSIVDRCILEEVANFVGGILLQPHPLPLRHIGFNYEMTRIKKEGRKRKNSTSSSVDSNDNGKKSRPVTPILSANVGTTTAAQRAPRNGHVGAKRPNKRANQVNRQSSSNTNGGLTLNIGGMASLGPAGPIRLNPTIGGPHREIRALTRAPMALGLTKIRKDPTPCAGARGAPYKAANFEAGKYQNEDSTADGTDPRTVFITPGESGPSTSTMSPAVDSVAPEEAPELIHNKGAIIDGSMTIIPLPNALAPKKPEPSPNWKKSVSRDLPDDFASILDIPIIFAKDDDNLSGLEKIDKIDKIEKMEKIEPTEQLELKLTPKLESKNEGNPPTKVVLLSNRSDKCYTNPSPGKVAGKPQNLNPIVLRTAMQKKSQGPIIKSNEAVKYTKIILTKRKSLINASTSDTVVLSRNVKK